MPISCKSLNCMALKRARKALGLPWWGGLDYEDGLQPGRGR